MFKRLGISLDRSNLANWMIKSGALVQLLINLLQDHLLERSLVHRNDLGTPLRGRRRHKY